MKNDLLKISAPIVCLALSGSLIWILSGHGSSTRQTDETAALYVPPIEAASDEGEMAIRTFRLLPGFQAALFAAEPMLANPVAFSIDYQGRHYVAETFRLHAGVTDMRRHTDWLVDDMAARTIEDRVAAMKKNLDDFESYDDEQDRIRLIEDLDGDGKADRATVFADGFNTYLTGLGAGLLMDRGNLYYTNIPDLWKLQDTDGDGRADVRKVLNSGYGVRFGYLGHDLHGLRKGPDGKIYFSIGDRGLHVKTGDSGLLNCPDTGAVLRCNPDGSELEIVHTGLRNPQELAFDDFGNLFTGDNNSDAGDQARWVYVVEGGDSGWTVGYQWLATPVRRGPWNAERLWHPYFDGQAAYIVPPIANIGAGPSGMAYYPGTGLPERYNGHFFLSDFRGGSVNSLVHAFTLKPRGASFEMTGRHDFIEGVLVTDVDFGPGAGLYLSDWVEGWGMTGKGRIYRVFDPALDQDAAVLQTAELLAAGFGHRPAGELLSLLRHPDQRVRLEAQSTLADHGVDVGDALLRTARESSHRMARLHALWALGQIGRKSGDRIPGVAILLDDTDAEVRAQAAKVLGDLKPTGAGQKLIGLLRDLSPRVRFFAAISLGELGSAEAIAPLLEMLRENGSSDPYLRHAGVMGLAGTHDVQALLAFSGDRSPDVKMGVLLALRRLRSPAVARFLSEEDLRDIRNRELLDSRNDGLKFVYPLARRVINANFRLGQAENAGALVEFAAMPGLFIPARVEALERVREWAEGSELDPVVGVWRPIPPRHPDSVRPAVLSRLHGLLRDPEDAIQQEAARLAVRYNDPETASVLLGLIEDETEAVGTRVEALRAIGSMGEDRLREAILISQRAAGWELRSEGLRLLTRLDSVEAVPVVASTLETGSTIEKQIALETLSQMKGNDARDLLEAWLDRLLQGRAEPEIQLDILEAARKQASARLREKVSRYEASLPEDDLPAAYRPALFGGNAERGRRIFFFRAEAQCQRCHSVGGRGGGEAGPELTHLARRADREYILASIVDPNREIAASYENVTLVMKDGSSYAGRVISEDDAGILLEVSDTREAFGGPAADEDPHSTVDVIAEGREMPDSGPFFGPTLRLSKSQVESRRRNLSSMPEDAAASLSKFELRDLVAFLASLD